MKEKEVERLLNLKKEEKILYEKGIVSICGIDEAGRGPLAGPVVVACSLMPKESMIEGVNDSKKISEKKREKIYEEIVQERMEKNFYVSLILPKDGPGYVEHWITCKRRANNMIMRGQINGTVYSIKNGLKKLREHNRKFKGEESSATSNIE